VVTVTDVVVVVLEVEVVLVVDELDVDEVGYLCSMTTLLLQLQL
jgi:hypothetical protein